MVSKICLDDGTELLKDNIAKVIVGTLYNVLDSAEDSLAYLSMGDLKTM